MPEHNTRQSATERLEEAVQTLSQAHSAMNDKLESILDRLSLLAIPADPTTPTSQPNQHHHHLKLEIPRFDGQELVPIHSPLFSTRAMAQERTWMSRVLLEQV